MQELARIWLKYDKDSLLDRLESLDDVNRLALTFGRDVARTFRLVTLQCNSARKTSGYGLPDAPVVGLLTRVAKLFRLVCRFYELDNGEYLSVFLPPPDRVGDHRHLPSARRRRGRSRF